MVEEGVVVRHRGTCLAAILVDVAVAASLCMGAPISRT